MSIVCGVRRLRSASGKREASIVPCLHCSEGSDLQSMLDTLGVWTDVHRILGVSSNGVPLNISDTEICMYLYRAHTYQPCVTFIRRMIHVMI